MRELIEETQYLKMGGGGGGGGGVFFNYSGQKKMYYIMENIYLKNKNK